MVPQQEQARLGPDERSCAPDGVAVTFRLRLDGEVETLLQVDEASGLFLGPIDPLGRLDIGGVVAEMVAVDRLIARCADDADLLDPAGDRLLGDDLEHGLGQPVAIDQGEHGLLHGIRSRKLPCPPTGRRDHCLGDLQLVSSLPLMRRRFDLRPVKGTGVEPRIRPLPDQERD